MQIELSPTFTNDVRLTTPGHGEEGIVTIEVTFRHKTLAEINEWRKRKLETDPTTGEISALTEAKWLTEVMASWAGPRHADGTAAPLTPEALAEVIQHRPRAGNEIMIHYLRAYGESRVKN